MAPLPDPRGPLTSALFAHLRGEGPPPAQGDVASCALDDEDAQLALYVSYELHYRGFDEVDDALEWDLGVLALRRAMEEGFLAEIRGLVPEAEDVAPDRVGATLFDMAAADGGRSVARYLGRSGTVEQYREYVMHRSAYQLKEADPHSWAIPRLEGRPKAALTEVQFDEYGSGDPDRIHALLFARSMQALGVDPAYGAHLNRLPARSLAAVNLMSLFGLNRAWLGAIVGHLAMYEITSSEPSRRLANGLRRLGLEEATGFFDEHVEADSVHENIAAYDMAQGLALQQPDMTASIVFGAAAVLAVEAEIAESTLSAWDAGSSSLRALAEPSLAAG